MIALTKIRDLTLSAASAAGRPLHLSAASGLVCRHSFIYVVADDELHLGVFLNGDREAGHLVRLFEGELPDLKSDRKKQKPDCEALALLPPSRDYPHGALLAFGSGVKRKRRRGALLGLDAHGALQSSPRVVDLSPVLEPLDDEFPALNIEGAAVSGDELRLFQRGNKRQSANAIISFQLSPVLEALSSGRPGAIKPSAIHSVELGEIDGIPLCFTDVTVLPDGDMVFSAVAEDTDTAYDDGPCVGAAIGIADNNGNVRSLHPLDEPLKVEGVHAYADGDAIKLVLVTDADDADVPAGLFSGTIER